LPIVFAVTGHRDIPPGDVPVLERAVASIFATFRKRYPTTPFVVLSPLAAGADRLVARVALAAEIPLRVPLPLEEPDYRHDFDPSENAEFDELVARADERYFIGYDAGNDATNVTKRDRRALQYRFVGRYLAKNAHVLIALWDGAELGATGGTADIVSYRRFGRRDRFSDADSLLDAPVTGAVYHIMTARAGEADRPVRRPVGTLVVKTRRGDVDESEDPFRLLYARIERFNKDRSMLGRLPESDGRITLSQAAEACAQRFQRRYLLALDAIYIVSTIAAIVLASAHRDVPVYGLAITYCVLAPVAYLCFKVAERFEWKDRAIEYRALEMALGVQHVWNTIGLGAAVADYYLRIQRSELEWIRDAVRTVQLLAPGEADPHRGIGVAMDYISGQERYFTATSERDRVRARRLEWIARIAIGFGIASSLLLAVVSIAHLGHAAALHVPLARGVAMHVQSADSSRWFGPFWDGDDLIRAIAVATIVAGVAHEYSQRRAFHAQSRRYTAALGIYTRASEVVTAAIEAPFEDRLRITKKVIFEVGKEALAENGDWLVMQRELPVEMLHV
jgi:hypothetical protein